MGVGRVNAAERVIDEEIDRGSTRPISNATYFHTHLPRTRSEIAF